MRGPATPAFLYRCSLPGLAGFKLRCRRTHRFSVTNEHIAQPEAPAEPKRAKKPAPRAGQKRGPARPRPEGERRAAKKEGAAAPKTTVKRPKKVVKEEPAKPDGGEQKE